ncbi:unnamed protein product [Cercospora beticola]|nr:unnamed protein product [Cercospora beticola]
MSTTRKSLEKPDFDVEHREHGQDGSAPQLYTKDEEPELHLKTWLALAAMCVLQYVSLLALVGPPTVLVNIGASFGEDEIWRYWIPNVVTLVQAALSPMLASISDVFQARKAVMVVLTTISFVGAAIAPNSGSIFRLIGASLMIGFGLAAAPLSYAVPSEIVPRRWRPLCQALINVAAGLGAITGPLVIGALTQQDPIDGWRRFYWVQMALWGFSVVGILFGYLPPKRTSDASTLMNKLGRIDWVGSALLTAAIALFVAGFNLVSVFAWSSAKVLGPLVSGVAAFIIFGLYEAFGTKTGILPHELFRGGGRHGWAFAIFCFLFFIEGVTFFALVTFYPVMTNALFTQDPLGGAVRLLPLFAASSAFTAIYGWASSHFKDIKYCMFVGFALYTGGIVGLATVQPGQPGVAIGSLTLCGIGLAGPLVLILTGTQLSVQHHLIATATALVVASRTLAASMFVAAYSTALNQRLGTYIPTYIANAVVPAGLPPQSIGAFIGAFASGAREAVAQVPGVTPAIIAAAGAAYQQAFADGVRVVFIIAAPFGAVGCVLCLLLPSFSDKMDYLVEAPLEDLHKRANHGGKV